MLGVGEPPPTPLDKSLIMPQEGAQKQLETLIATVPPMMYLSEEERKRLITESAFICKVPDKWIIEMKSTKDTLCCFLLVEGEAHVFDSGMNFLELLPAGTFFGVDGPLFGRRFYNVKVASHITLLQIPPTTFESLLKIDTVFTLSIARTLSSKHNILDSLNTLKTYIRESKGTHEIDKKELIKRYKAIDSSLHPLCASTGLDVDGWLYSIRRLPSNITSTFIFFITTKTPDMLCHPDVANPVSTSARPRSIFRMMEGKCVVILRDMETDLFDFLSNLCIHIVESAKIIQKLNSPLILKDLLTYREDQEATVSLLKHTSLTADEVTGLAKIWPTKLAEHIANILLHFNDFHLKIFEPQSHLKQNPIEKWITRLWQSVIQLLGLSSTKACGAIPDDEIVVDVIQVRLVLKS